MTYNPDIHHRRSIRLKDYDYSSAGVYFVTICTMNRECLFGEVTDGQMILNRFGKILREEWLKSADIRKEIQLDEFVVMPNHAHGIIAIENAGASVGATGRSPHQPGPRPRSLGAFVGGFKSATTTRINVIRQNPGSPVWQRNYYERVIRYERELLRLRDYIADNPAKWAEDKENPVFNL